MKIICFSDLHLEFGKSFDVPEEDAADVMILAGDIITFADFSPLEKIVRLWRKPILYVAGNHEFYTRTLMQDDIARFQAWAANYPHLYFLQDEPVTIDGVHFFGGTMWTDFNGGKAQVASDRAKKTGRGLTTVVMFILVPQAQLKKRFDIDSVAKKWIERLPSLVTASWPDEKEEK